MKASPTEPEEEYLTENPYEFRRPDPPWLTIFSFLAVPVLTPVSLPFLKLAFRGEPLPGDLPHSGQFDAVVDLFAVALVVFASSLLGLFLAHLARKKNEPWKGLRTVAWIMNGVVTLFLFFGFSQILMTALR